jgi:four helix bundle protein
MEQRGDSIWNRKLRLIRDKLLSMTKFRFQDLTIWQQAIQQSDKLLDLADLLEEKKRFRFAEQLRGAALSISNNIAEGAGSSSNQDFARFLNYAHRSAFEVVNILIILNRRKLVSNEISDKVIEDLDILCRMITSFKRSLFKN